MGTILLIVLILLLFGAFPAWPYSRGWGYGPSSLLSVVLTVILVLMVFEVIAAPWHPYFGTRTVVVTP